MKIIIAGDGKMGSTLIRQLSQEGYDLTIIDSNPKVLESSEERYDVMVVQGNCASMNTLLSAGVKEADLLIALTGADEINLLCCMTAHGLNAQIHTIARMRNPEYIDQIYSMRNMFNLSLTVNPEKQTALEIERLLRYPGFLKRDTFAKGRVEIVELKIEKGSPLCSVQLSNVSNIVKCRVLICSVLRDGHAITPDGNFVLQEDDRIFVTAPTDTLTLLLKNLGIITHKVKRVILAGGGGVSYYLAKQLESRGIEVMIIDNNEARCVQLSQTLPNASIVYGDISNQFLLDSVGISECDALITMTGLDELNMVVSLYGHNVGIPQIITKIGRMDNTNMLGNMPLGSIISPKELCSNTIVRYVRAMKNQAGAALTIHSIADGQAEATEFLVDSTVKNCGIPLKQLHVKSGVLIACITHQGSQIIPNGDTCFYEGDTVITVSSAGNFIYQLNDIFE